MVKGRLKRSIVALTLAISMLGSTLLSGGPLFVKADGEQQTSLGEELVVNGGFGDDVSAVSLSKAEEEAQIGSTQWMAKGLSDMPLDFSVDNGALVIGETKGSASPDFRTKVKSTSAAGTYTFSAKVMAVGEFAQNPTIKVISVAKTNPTGDKTKTIQVEPNKWVDISDPFTTTAAYTNMLAYFRFSNLNEGYWLIDDITYKDSSGDSVTKVTYDFEDTSVVGKSSTTGINVSGTWPLDASKYYVCGISDEGPIPFLFEVVTDATKDASTPNNHALKISTAPASGQVSSTLEEPLGAGKTYVLSADVTPTGIQDLSADEAGLAKITFTAGGQSVTKTAAEVSAAGNKISGEITVPVGATDLDTVSLKVEDFTNGTWTIDNVSLKEKITAAPTEPTLSVSASASEVEQGKTVEVTAALVDPSQLTQGSIAWSAIPAEGITITPDTADENKATVLVADTVEAGKEVTITATKARKDGKEALTAICTFIVKQKTVPLQGVSIAENDIALEIGDEKQLSVTFDPDNATNTEVTWESDSPAVAAVDENGNVTAVAAGTAVIKVISAENNEIIDTVSVKVKVEPSLSISVTPGEVTQGGTVTATATLTDPDGLTGGQITWTSNVAEGITITPNGDGSTATISVDTSVAKDTVVTITATKVRTGEKADLTAEGTFTVKENIVPLTKVEIAQESVALEFGGATVLNATLAPENATNKNLIWSSSDDAVATVDQNGNVTAKGAGTAVITVASEAYPELKDSVSVTVIKKMINNGSFDVMTGEKISIPYTDKNGSSAAVTIKETGFMWYALRVAGDKATNTSLKFEIAEGGRTGNAMKIWRDEESSGLAVGASLQQTKIAGLVEGEKYLLTAFVKSEGVNPNSTIEYKWLNADNVTYKEPKITAADCAGEWTAMTLEFTCGKVTREGSLQLIVKSLQKGAWYI
ncbi:MAG: Ig-like domain-containing protein, partial [Lachnospiraceae bacterium]|nr:Ig-like domain-containing protein [Lachnospiraceae bacterium]